MKKITKCKCIDSVRIKELKKFIKYLDDTLYKEGAGAIYYPDGGKIYLTDKLMWVLEGFTSDNNPVLTTKTKKK